MCRETNLKIFNFLQKDPRRDSNWQFMTNVCILIPRAVVTVRCPLNKQLLAISVVDPDPDGSIINPRYVNSELRIRILSVYQDFKTISSVFKIFNGLPILLFANTFVFNSHRNVQVRSGSSWIRN
jgi:hypothetical protein